jgi:hypothetical protein
MEISKEIIFYNFFVIFLLTNLIYLLLNDIGYPAKVNVFRRGKNVGFLSKKWPSCRKLKFGELSLYFSGGGKGGVKKKTPL